MAASQLMMASQRPPPLTKGIRGWTWWHVPAITAPGKSRNTVIARPALATYRDASLKIKKYRINSILQNFYRGTPEEQRLALE